MPDGTKPVNVPKIVWRSQIRNEYHEPELIDLGDPLDWMFDESVGKTAVKRKGGPSPRNDIIEFDKDRHEKEFDNNIQWRECEDTFKPIFEILIKTHWDAFAQAGMKNSILGYEFHIDTADTKPVCCKSPRYGPHESRVMRDLVKKLENKGLIEDDQGPWGALVVLAAKPNQGHVHWSQYVFRLCVSYRRLNSITRPFMFYIVRCDDAVEDIGEAVFFITMDLDSGYWQVKLHHASKEKTAFFTPEGKKHWNVMPMGILNAHPFFVAMSMDFKQEWHKQFLRDPLAAIQRLLDLIEEHKDILQEAGMTEATKFVEKSRHRATQIARTCNPDAKVIVDDVLLHDVEALSLLAYFMELLIVYIKYRVTVNLRRTRFFPAMAKFVGIDVLKQGNAPSASKYDSITKLPDPRVFKDIRAIIGLTGFYQRWIPQFEHRIVKLRDLLKHEPPTGATEEEEEKILARHWTQEHTEEAHDIKQAVLDGPVLKRPNSKRRFYLKTDWCKDGMGGVLLQPEETEEAEEAMWKEIEGGKCQFDKAVTGLRLRPVAFISRRCKKGERDYHSYVGEAATGRWAMSKFRKYLFGREFTWITDCNGVVKFMEGEAEITHATQRWRLEMLAFHFTVVHRPDRMLYECDLLSRYEKVVDSWKSNRVVEPQKQEERDIPLMTLAFTQNQDRDARRTFTASNRPVEIVGAHTATVKTELAKICDRSRTMWIIGAGLQQASEAARQLGIDPLVTLSTDEEQYWQELNDCPGLETVKQRMDKKLAKGEVIPTADWIFIMRGQDYNENEDKAKVLEILEYNEEQQEQTVFIAVQTAQEAQVWEQVMAKENWYCHTQEIEAVETGAVVNTRHRMIRAKKKKWTPKKLAQGIPQPMTLNDILDPGDANYSDYIAIPRAADNDTNIDVTTEEGTTETRRVYQLDEQGPNWSNRREQIGRSEFVVQTTDGRIPYKARGIRPWESLQLLGMGREEAKKMLKKPHAKWDQTRERMVETVPRTVWEQVLAETYTEEEEKPFIEPTAMAALAMYGNQTDKHVKAITKKRINKFTTLPLPTRETWMIELEKDEDTALIMDALKWKRPLQQQRLKEKSYWNPWKNGRFEVEDGVLYEYEVPKATHIRQLRRAVVPNGLRDSIIAGYHASPMAGHVDAQKTYYRISTRYWWPKMSNDIREAVNGCGHCKIANITSHKNQKILQALSQDEPFDICCIDVWSPGRVKPTDPNLTREAKRRKKTESSVVTYLCASTAFACTAELTEVDSAAMAVTVFTQFFIPRGLPKLVLLDEGSKNKDKLTRMCERMGVSYYVVSKENHDGILNERFHPYLNKVQKIGVVDMMTYEQFMLSTAFATYAWNASPVAGTDIQRAFAATSRHFNFPLDEAPNDLALTRIVTEGSGVLAERTQVMFPLWWRQKELLKVLNEDRRKYHRELKNKNRT